MPRLRGPRAWVACELTVRQMLLHELLRCSGAVLTSSRGCRSCREYYPALALFVSGRWAAWSSFYRKTWL